jgi:ABC-type histidine transport system ATPase subunit
MYIMNCINGIIHHIINAVIDTNLHVVECRRLALATVLALELDILILDEPTTAQDEKLVFSYASNARIE